MNVHMNHKDLTRNPFSYKDWYDLDLPSADSNESTEKTPANQSNIETQKPQDCKTGSELPLPPHENMLAWDVIEHPEYIYRHRISSTGMTSRQAAGAKAGLIQKELLVEIFAGKILFLAPTEKLYDLVGLESPYKRKVAIAHPFQVLLTAKLLEAHPLVTKVYTEFAIGDANSTVDVVALLKDGRRWAYEITLNVSNVAANAAKLQNKGFAEIIFVCQDYDIKQATQAKIRNAGFDPDFLACIRYQLISGLLKQHKQMSWSQ